MADLPPYSGSNSDTGVEPGHRSPSTTPRWVKVFGIIAIVLILLFVIQHLAGNFLGGGGLHTPR